MALALLACAEDEKPPAPSAEPLDAPLFSVVLEPDVLVTAHADGSGAVEHPIESRERIGG